MNSMFRSFYKFPKPQFSKLNPGASKLKRGEIVNYVYKPKKLPDFTKIIAGEPVYIQMKKSRAPTKLKAVMYFAIYKDLLKTII